jgi:hypothetical protein
LSQLPIVVGVVYAQVVLHVLGPGHPLGDIFGVALVLTVIDRAGECDFSILDRDRDGAGVDMGIVSQTVIHVLADAVIRTGVVFRAPPAMTALVRATLIFVAADRRFVVAEPR